LATLIFIGVWIVVAVAVFILAMRRNAQADRPGPRSRRRGRFHPAMIAAVVASFVGFGVVLPAIGFIGAADNPTTARAGIELSEDEREGREIFGENCARCHTLVAAKAAGLTGPNLDEMRPPRELTVDAVVNGRQRGRGTMPADLVNEPEAEKVGAFIDKVAGR
jgi:mono/diheme cytochrome c family protein